MTNENTFAIYDYQIHLRQARGLHDKTIDAALRHIRRFEQLTGELDFRQISPSAIVSYKEALQREKDDNQSLSASTIVHSLGDLKSFFGWLMRQPGYRSMSRDLHEYFTAPRRLVQIAQAPTEKYVPSVDEIHGMIKAARTDTFIERRDRAMIAFLYLSGARDGAIVTLRLKHIDLDRKIVIQDAREVATKASKTMRTAWFPVGTEIEGIVIDWIKELKDLGATEDDPLFPRAFRHLWGQKQAPSFEFLTSAAPLRAVLKSAAASTGTPYFRPHAVRSTIARMIEHWGATAEERKALSQNLGHEDYRTTLMYYGALDEHRQHMLVDGIRGRGDDIDLHHDILMPYSRAPEHIRKSFLTILEPYRRGLHGTAE